MALIFEWKSSGILSYSRCGSTGGLEAIEEETIWYVFVECHIAFVSFSQFSVLQTKRGVSPLFCDVKSFGDVAANLTDVRFNHCIDMFYCTVFSFALMVHSD